MSHLNQIFKNKERNKETSIAHGTFIALSTNVELLKERADSGVIMSLLANNYFNAKMFFNTR